STALYETLGNTEATSVVTQSVALLARVVQNCDGTVVKTLGDGLMAMFAEPASAVMAADEMHDQLERIGTRPADAQPRPALKLQVGLALGEVVEMAGDYFGHPANLAARLLDHARAHEAPVTSTRIGARGPVAPSRFRSRD